MTTLDDYQAPRDLCVQSKTYPEQGSDVREGENRYFTHLGRGSRVLHITASMSGKPVSTPHYWQPEIETKRSKQRGLNEEAHLICGKDHLRGS